MFFRISSWIVCIVPFSSGLARKCQCSGPLVSVTCFVISETLVQEAVMRGVVKSTAKSQLLCATSRSYLEGDLLHGPFRNLHIAWSVQPDADAAADRQAEALFKAFCVIGDTRTCLQTPVCS